MLSRGTNERRSTMYKRNFLKGLVASTVGLSTGSIPAAAWAGLAQGPHRTYSSDLQRRTSSCKIIGIGGGGCNAVSAFLLSNVDEQPARITAEFICIDVDMQSLSYVQAVRQKSPSALPVRTILLSPYGVGGQVNDARVAAFTHVELLNATVSDADAVMLVTGLGGGTGSAIAPIMARLARNAGAASFAVVVTPFDFEGPPRNRTSDIAIRHLEREADFVVRVSNQELADTMGDDTLMSDLSIAQEQRIATYIRAFLVPKPT
jgi:cell division protein FtsZ